MTITKRYRVTIDYEVEIQEWSKEVLAAVREGDSESSHPGYRKWEERSRRLYLAFIEHPELVEKYCRADLIDDLQLQNGASIITGNFGLPEGVDVLAEAIKFLPPDDIEYWEEVINDEYFFEATELVRRLFQSSVERVIQDLNTGEEIKECEEQADESLQITESVGDWCPCNSGKRYYECHGSNQLLS